MQIKSSANCIAALKGNSSMLQLTADIWEHTNITSTKSENYKGGKVCYL